MTEVSAEANRANRADGNGRTLVDIARSALQTILERATPYNEWIFIPRTKYEANAENSMCTATGFDFEKLLPVLEKAGLAEPSQRDTETGNVIMYKIKQDQLQHWVENELPLDEHSYIERLVRDENGKRIGPIHFFSNGKCLNKYPRIKFLPKTKKRKCGAAVTTAFKPSHNSEGITKQQSTECDQPHDKEPVRSDETTKEPSEYLNAMQSSADESTPAIPRATKRIRGALDQRETPNDRQHTVAFEKVKRETVELLPTLLPKTKSFY